MEVEGLEAAGGFHVTSADEIKMTDNMTLTETLEKIKALGFDARERKRSKYLSYPYINLRPRHTGMPAETEDSRTPHLSHKADGSSIANRFSNESPSITKSGSKRFRRKWYKKFVNWGTMSSSPEFISASPADLLSGLYSKAVDCMFPIENKNFDLVEWFFCRYRVSHYNEEAELATSLVNVEGRNSGPPVRNDALDMKTGKGRKNKKLANAVRHKTKSLSGLSDMNVNNATSDFLLKDFLEMDKLKQKRRMEEVTLSLQKQNIGMTNLNVSGVKCNPEVLSYLASQGKRGPKRKTKRIGTLENPTTQSAAVLPDGDWKSTNCSSLVVDLQLVSPHENGGIPEKHDGQNKEELGLMASNPALSASQPGLVQNIANPTLTVSTTSDVDIASGNKTGKRRRKTKIKPAAEIPDLNGASTESNSIAKEFQDVNGQLKPKHYRKRNKKEPKSENLRSLGVGVGPLGFTCLFLKFAPVVSVPSKEDLLATFGRFGPLKESEMQLLKDAGIAQIVFVNSSDAGDAFRSIVQNKPFGTTLIDCKLHLSTSYPSGEAHVTPAQPSGSKPLPSGASSIDYIRQNLKMMTLMLEKSGDNLSPQMRAKLEDEIKNLMSKVNSMACSFSDKV